MEKSKKNKKSGAKNTPSKPPDGPERTQAQGPSFFSQKCIAVRPGRSLADEKKETEYACPKDELARNMRLNFFDEPEIESLLKELDAFGTSPFGDLSRKITALCCQLSNTSSNLVERTLGHVRSASALLPASEFESWLARAFDLLDSSGLQSAVHFISKTGADDLEVFKNPGGLKLDSITVRLELYLKGISGIDFRVAAADPVPSRSVSSGPVLSGGPCYTDTSTIYLPPRLDIFCGPEENLLLYKLMAAHKWAQVACGTLAPTLEDIPFFNFSETAAPSETGTSNEGLAPIEGLFSPFSDKDREFALDLYNVLESIRLDAFLKKEAPGLFEKTQSLRLLLLASRSLPDEKLSERKRSLRDQSLFIEGLFELYLAQGQADASYKVPVNEKVIGIWRQAREYKDSGESARALIDLCRADGFFTSQENFFYDPLDLLFIGRIRPDEVGREAYAKQLALQRKFEGIVTKLLGMPDLSPEPEKQKNGKKKTAPFRQAEPGKTYLLVRGKLIELDNSLMKEALSGGHVPGGVLVDGAAAGGRHVYRLSDFFAEDDSAHADSSGGIKYDEWDYRRGGYRKGWCTLFEQDVRPGHGPFVEQTLKRYGGYVTALRNKFELLRREPKLLRRQAEGEDIDMDAMVESLADIKAGIIPSGEDLFVRYDRHERDIAALFLLDMSGSTKGWVNQAEKESLVLMCEALQSLGDRYAIYGFSGMTRGRCDFYRIKSFDEAFGQIVKKRIAGIDPKDYTRMGSALRHASSILEKTGARTRLLIVLSDGKPEDYDAYKGDYGIEDTRKALIEARERGLHPFCITIDKEARSYLPHMYGAVNYVLIDNVKKLPSRIPEIYRRLTA